MSTCQFSALMKKNLFHFLSIIACAMGMKRYVEANISLKSHTTVKYFMKMWSSVSDTLIFIFLGVSTIGENHEWNWPYICFTVIFCLIWRALGMVKSCFFWWLSETYNSVKWESVSAPNIILCCFPVCVVITDVNPRTGKGCPSWYFSSSRTAVWFKTKPCPLQQFPTLCNHHRQRWC